MKKIALMAFLLAATIGLSGCTLGDKISGIFNKNKMVVLEPEAAKTKAQTYINENLLPEGITVAIGEVTEESGLYKLAINFSNGNKVDSYMTKDGKQFFTEGMDMNKAKASADTLPTNEPTMELKTEIITEGTGEATVKSGDSITVDYTGTLEDGTKFDSSVDSGQPFTFTIGEGTVIQGWEQGLIGMKVGEERKLIIPAELGYGAQGQGPSIPPNSNLLFDVKLISIN
jgi:peptidylprolyl isomerase